MPTINSIFEGATIAPARDFIADVCAARKRRNIVLPCVGRYAALESMTQKGIPASRMRVSDLSMFSTIIGYLADPEKSIYDLGLDETADPAAEPFLRGAQGEREYAAGFLLALKYFATDPKTIYARNLRREMRTSVDKYRAHIDGRLEDLLGNIHGIHYEQADVWDEARYFAEGNEDDFFFCNLPGYRKGYSKMFGEAEAMLGHTELSAKEFDPRHIGEFLEVLEPAPGLALTYVPNGLKDVPSSWVPIFAMNKSDTQTTYVVANHNVKDRYAHQKIGTGEPVQFEIYDDQEITEDTVIRFVPVDEATALYYRDLFVHRLGSTQAEYYFLLTIDGRVTSVCGLNDQHLNHGTSEYVSEVFQITRSSNRYARLAKLLMRCITSDDFKQTLMATRRSAQFREPRGIQTTSITRYREGKIDRSVMKRVHAEPHPAGWKLIYRADFRDETFSDNVKLWLQKWGDIKRKGYEDYAWDEQGRAYSPSDKERTVG